MAKKRKFETETLLRIIDDYIQQKADFQKITFTAVALFCKDSYSFMADINYQDFSRNKEVKQYIEDYNIRLERRLMDIDASEAVAQDKLIDSRILYGKSDTEIDKEISRVNKYLSSVYENDRKAVASVYNKAEKIIGLKKENQELDDKCNTLSLEKAKLQKQLAEERHKNKELREKVNALIKYIEKHIYDKEIQRHLIDIGLLVSNDDNEFEGRETLMDTSLEKIVTAEILTAGESNALMKLAQL